MKVPSEEIIRKIVAEAKWSYRRFRKENRKFRIKGKYLILPFICGARIDRLFINKDLEMEYIETEIQTDKTYHIRIDVNTVKIIKQNLVTNQEDYTGVDPFKPVTKI